jgi:hypothetical protein
MAHRWDSNGTDGPLLHRDHPSLWKGRVLINSDIIKTWRFTSAFDYLNRKSSKSATILYFKYVLLAIYIPKGIREILDEYKLNKTIILI